MTTSLAVSDAVGGSEAELLPRLQAIHRLWLQQIRKVLDAARGPEAGIHCRWRAVRYLNFIAAPRFEIERGAVESLGQMVDPGHATQLWVAAELMAFLGWQLDHELALWHSPREFSALTGKFEKALTHWCEAVEGALGNLSWRKLPSQAQRRFELLGTEEVHHDV
ncbi:MAG TPA: hypothetical protein VIG04_01635 [Gemmatimonadales bacterium]|jgi:hypothetical protein